MRFILSIKVVRIKDSMWGWENGLEVKSFCFVLLKIVVWILVFIE